MKCSDRTTVFATTADDCAIWAKDVSSLDGTPLVEVTVELETDLPPIDGGLEYDSNPTLNVSWRQDRFNVADLPGTSIHIPSSYDEDQQNHITDFIYFEHLEFNDVRIEIIGRTDDLIHVRITGKALDPTAPEGPEMEITADAEVEFTP